MATLDFLNRVMVEGVWCNPHRNVNVIFKPYRHSRNIGESGVVKYLEEDVVLPDRATPWHIWVVGGRHPSNVGLPDTHGHWFRFSEMIEFTEIYLDVYNNDGRMVPREHIYYCYTVTGGLLFAINGLAKTGFNVTEGNLFFRIYANASLQYPNPAATAGYTTLETKYCQTPADILEIQTNFNIAKALPGHAFGYVNGFKVAEVNHSTVTLGDTVEVVYDATVVRKHILKLSELLSFTSTLDSEQKYLLHAAPAIGENVLNHPYAYADDVEVYVVHKKNISDSKGVLFPKNNPEHLRNVTFRDWAVSVDRILACVDIIRTKVRNVPSIPHEEIFLEIFVRDDAYYRTLLNSPDKVRALYKLNSADILPAMIGANAVVPFWQAANLEANAFNRTAGDFDGFFSNTEITQTLGYNGCSSVINPGLIAAKQPGSATNTLPVPPAYQLHLPTSCYKLEYYANGLCAGLSDRGALVGSGNAVAPTNPNVAWVEYHPGKLNELNGLSRDSFGTTSVTAYGGGSHKLYYCGFVSNSPDDIWREASASQYTFNASTNTYTWTDVNISALLRLKDLSRIWHSVYTATGTDIFTKLINGASDYKPVIFMIAEQNVNSPVPPLKKKKFIPPQQLRIISSTGHTLIENIDYFVKWPYVCIVSKDVLKRFASPANYSFTVIESGLSSVADEYVSSAKSGFINHGLVSANRHFDLLDDKPTLFCIAGQVMPFSAVKFAEGTWSSDTLNVLNGQPYMILPYYEDLYLFADKSTPEMIAEDSALDVSVENYLTLKLPEPIRNELMIVQSKYTLYSPFFQAIVAALKDGDIVPSSLGVNFSDQQVINTCLSYEYILEFDPINSAKEMDRDFVNIHPIIKSTEVLKLTEWRFMQAVQRIYGNGWIDISQFFTVVPD